MTPYRPIGDIGKLLLDPSYCLPIFPKMTLNIHVVEHLHHNQHGLYTLNPLARRGVVFPTSLACVYDANWGILCKDQDRGETSPTLWITDRGEKSMTLLYRDPSTPGSLHLNSTPWELSRQIKSLIIKSNPKFDIFVRSIVQNILQSSSQSSMSLSCQNSNTNLYQSTKSSQTFA